jgi:hypothetical protein
MTSKANGRSNSGRGKKQDFGVDFVNIRLSTEEKRKLASQEWSGDDLANALIRWVENGQKVSFTYSERNESVICSLTSPEDPVSHRRCSVSSFGPDAAEAAKVAWYKFAVLTDGGNWHLYEVDDEFGAYG